MLDRHPLLHTGEASAQPPSLNTWWKGRGWRLVLSCRTDRIRRNKSSVRRPHLRVDHRAPAAPRRSATPGQLSSGGPGAGPERAGEEGTRVARLAPRVRQKWQSAQGQASQTRLRLGRSTMGERGGACHVLFMMRCNYIAIGAIFVAFKRPRLDSATVRESKQAESSHSNGPYHFHNHARARR